MCYEGISDTPLCQSDKLWSDGSHLKIGVLARVVVAERGMCVCVRFVCALPPAESRRCSSWAMAESNRSGSSAWNIDVYTFRSVLKVRLPRICIVRTQSRCIRGFSHGIS